MSDILKHTWATDVYDALIALGGRASLKKIYHKVRKIRLERGDSWPQKGDAAIRKEIKLRVSESSAFTGSKPDLYYAVKGLGNGVWALREKANQRKCFSRTEQTDIPYARRRCIEGDLHERTFLAYSRNQKNVQICKALDNFTCRACGFHWDNRIVEAHHLEPLFLTKTHTVTPDDLITLCPTCHRIAHILIDSELENYRDADALVTAIRQVLSEKNGDK